MSRNKVGVVVGALMGVLLVSGFLARGWIRDDAVPTYVNVTSGRQLKKTANEVFVPIREQFEGLGIVFAEPKQSDFFKREPCWLSYYVNLRITVHCTTSINSNTPKTDEFAEKFKQEATMIERYLLKDGWSIERTYAVDPVKLADIFESTIHYTTFYKQHGKSLCRVSVSREDSGSLPGGTTSALNTSLSCVRDVKIFGGNNVLSDPGLFE